MRKLDIILTCFHILQNSMIQSTYQKFFSVANTYHDGNTISLRRSQRLMLTKTSATLLSIAYMYVSATWHHQNGLQLYQAVLLQHVTSNLKCVSNYYVTTVKGNQSPAHICSTYLLSLHCSVFESIEGILKFSQYYL